LLKYCLHDSHDFEVDDLMDEAKVFVIGEFRFQKIYLRACGIFHHRSSDPPRKIFQDYVLREHLYGINYRHVE